MTFQIESEMIKVAVLEAGQRDCFRKLQRRIILRPGLGNADEQND